MIDFINDQRNQSYSVHELVEWMKQFGAVPPSEQLLVSAVQQLVTVNTVEDVGTAKASVPVLKQVLTAVVNNGVSGLIVDWSAAVSRRNALRALVALALPLLSDQRQRSAVLQQAALSAATAAGAIAAAADVPLLALSLTPCVVAKRDCPLLSSCTDAWLSLVAQPDQLLPRHQKILYQLEQLMESVCTAEPVAAESMMVVQLTGRWQELIAADTSVPRSHHRPADVDQVSRLLLAPTAPVFCKTLVKALSIVSQRTLRTITTCYPASMTSLLLSDATAPTTMSVLLHRWFLVGSSSAQFLDHWKAAAPFDHLAPAADLILSGLVGALGPLGAPVSPSPPASSSNRQVLVACLDVVGRLAESHALWLSADADRLSCHSAAVGGPFLRSFCQSSAADTVCPVVHRLLVLVADGENKGAAAAAARLLTGLLTVESGSFWAPALALTFAEYGDAAPERLEDTSSSTATPITLLFTTLSAVDSCSLRRFADWLSSQWVAVAVSVPANGRDHTGTTTATAISDGTVSPSSLMQLLTRVWRGVVRLAHVTQQLAAVTQSLTAVAPLLQRRIRDWTGGRQLLEPLLDVVFSELPNAAVLGIWFDQVSACVCVDTAVALCDLLRHTVPSVGAANDDTVPTQFVGHVCLAAAVAVGRPSVPSPAMAQVYDHALRPLYVPVAGATVSDGVVTQGYWSLQSSVLLFVAHCLRSRLAGGHPGHHELARALERAFLLAPFMAAEPAAANGSSSSSTGDQTAASTAATATAAAAAAAAAEAAAAAVDLSNLALRQHTSPVVVHTGRLLLERPVLLGLIELSEVTASMTTTATADVQKQQQVDREVCVRFASHLIAGLDYLNALWKADVRRSFPVATLLTRFQAMVRTAARLNLLTPSLRAVDQIAEAVVDDESEIHLLLQLTIDSCRTAAATAETAAASPSPTVSLEALGRKRQLSISLDETPDPAERPVRALIHRQLEKCAHLYALFVRL